MVPYQTVHLSLICITAKERVTVSGAELNLEAPHTKSRTNRILSRFHGSVPWKESVVLRSRKHAVRFCKKALFSNMWTTESHSSWSISLIKTVCFSDLHRFEVTSLPMATKCHQLPQSVKSPQSKPLKSIKLTRIDGAGSENSSKKKPPTARRSTFHANLSFSSV